jgi:hypothetical protein
MPSQLLTNEAISFIVGKTFTYNGVEYPYGTDFDQDVVRVPVQNIETLVRNRFLIPVVDSYDDKPRHWYREIKIRSDVEAKLGLPEGAGGAPPPAPGRPSRPTEETGYDPGDHLIREVKAYQAEHPEETQELLDKELAGKNRATLVAWLQEQLGG